MLKAGLKISFLNVYEDSDETGDGITKRLLKTIVKADLDVNNNVVYGADNASLNYGKH